MVQKAQSSNLVLKFNLYIFVYDVFVLLLSCWSLFEVAFLEIKTKKYLHVSYMQLFDCLCIHNITDPTSLNI